MVTAQRIDGVDISRWQTQDIDYAKAKAAGVRWVYHKATEGTSVIDPNYARRRAETAKAGLPFGAYHFAHPSADAAASARRFLEVAKPKPGDMRPMLDFEHEEFTRWSIGKRSAWVKTFVDIVEEATGVPPFIYTQMDLTSTFDCPLWVARYSNANTDPRVPEPWRVWTVWQFTNGVFGVPSSTPGFGKVDGNVMNGDPARLTAVFRLAAKPAPKPKPKPAPAKVHRFRFGSWNALGAHHTDSRSGKKFGTRWLKSAARTRLLVKKLREHSVGVVGLQEFQAPQRRLFIALAGLLYATHGSVDNYVAWRRRRWKVRLKTFITIPYFGGERRRMPVVFLERHGYCVGYLSVHNPAFRENLRHREDGFKVEAEWVDEVFRKHPWVDAFVVAADRNMPKRAFTERIVRLGADQVVVAEVWEIDSLVVYNRPGGKRPLRLTRPKTVNDEKISDHPLLYADGEVAA